MTPPAATSRLIRRSRARGASILLALLRRMPLEMLSIVKSDLRPVGRLDYPRKRIDMVVNSPWQAYRLRSCAKEPETVEWLENQMRAGDVFYDIGANVGAYSLVAFAVTDGAARIIAFEPGFGTFAELCRNIHLNHAERSITPLSIALSDRTGLAEFRYSDTTPGAALHNWDASAPGETHAPELVLPTVGYRLDDLIGALDLPLPTLLKLDVDGPESEVLAGADRALSNPALRGCIVELDIRTQAYEDVVARLAGRGFQIASRHVRGGDGPLHNVIFARA